jgi:hypothetical protein
MGIMLWSSLGLAVFLAGCGSSSTTPPPTSTTQQCFSILHQFKWLFKLGLWVPLWSDWLPALLDHRAGGVGEQATEYFSAAERLGCLFGEVR